MMMLMLVTFRWADADAGAHAYAYVDADALLMLMSRCADAVADAVTPSSNTFSYTRRSVLMSLGRSFLI